VTNACLQAATNFNINGGTMQVKGVEASLDALYQVADGRLAIGLNGAHQDATWDEVAAVAGAPLLGSIVAQSPEWTYSANVNFRHPMGAGLSGFVNVAWNGQQGGGQDTVTLATPFIPLDDVSNVDFRTGVDFRQIEVALFVKNVTNQIIPVLKLQQVDIPLANRYSRPRTFGVTATYRW
jgi:iron complex outermembrane receptor protein